MATIYVVWGSTFLAIDLGLDTLPPLLLMAMRHLTAGGLLLAIAWALERPTRDDFRPRRLGAALLVGGLLFLGSHGTLAWGQQTVPSGVAALVAATIPLTFAALDRIAYGRKISRLGIAGLALGFAGVAVLIGPPGEGRIDPVATAVIVAGTITWAAGSLLSRGGLLPSRPLTSAASTMLGGGALLALAATAGGEPWEVGLDDFTAQALGAVAYLSVAGSIVAFSAYVWLLRVARTTLVSTYAFVNPIVAVLLGAAIRDEPVNARVLAASAAIVVAVAMVVLAPALPTRPPGREPAPTPAEELP
jgi:drug/metabolite transporter (DMT)-like permease